MPTVYTLAQVVAGAHCAAGGAPSMAPNAAAQMEDAEPVRRTRPPTGRRGGRPDLADGVARQPHADRAPLLGLAGQVVHALLGQTLAGVQDERELARARAAHISRACTGLSIELVLPAPASHIACTASALPSPPMRTSFGGQSTRPEQPASSDATVSSTFAQSQARRQRGLEQLRGAPARAALRAPA